MLYVPQVILAAALIAAVASDLRSRRIPNVLVALLLCTGLALQAHAFGVAGIARACIGAVVAGTLFVPIYLANGMGAGDVKLIAAIGSFLGPIGGAVAAVYALVLGGVVGLGVLIFRWVTPAARSERGPDVADATGAEAIPYATVIAGGTTIACWLATPGSQPLLQLGH